MSGTVRYFVSKATDMAALRRAQQSGLWACADRQNPPHPRDTLQTAREQSKVILVFSVTNARGWHGYASMETNPGEGAASESPVDPTELVTETLPKTANTIDSCINSQKKDNWHYFKIKWIKLYLDEHGERCLPLNRTEDLKLEGDVSVNKSRNFQEIPAEVGLELCERIDLYYTDLDEQKHRKQESLQEKLPPVFFHPSDHKNVEATWTQLLECVGRMGRVLLACPFGSQRYNLDTAESDVDMFVVYAADTHVMLGFNPPQTTIKNKESEACDYTVHEVHRFCELLTLGDPRCTETLFMHPSTYVYIDDDFRQLCQQRALLLTGRCLDRYLRDATGAKGLKLLEKWFKSGEVNQTPMPAKVGKLLYIILRLLQNARDVAKGDDLVVHRPAESPERGLLMQARHCTISYDTLKLEVDRLLHEIEEMKKVRLIEMEGSSKASSEMLAEKYITDWLMRLRYKNFHEYMQILR